MKNRAKSIKSVMPPLPWLESAGDKKGRQGKKNSGKISWV